MVSPLAAHRYVHLPHHPGGLYLAKWRNYHGGAYQMATGFGTPSTSYALDTINVEYHFDCEAEG